MTDEFREFDGIRLRVECGVILVDLMRGEEAFEWLRTDLTPAAFHNIYSMTLRGMKVSVPLLFT